MPWQNGEFVYTSELNNTSNTETQQETKDDVDFDRPIVNETGLGVVNTQINIEKAREITGSQVFERIKNSPEIVSIMQAVVDDIIGSGIKTYEYVGRTGNAQNPGKRSKRDAERFWKSNKEVIANSILDAMAMGDGYLYKKSVDEESAEEKIRSHVKNAYNFNHRQYEKAAVQRLKQSVRDNLNETRDLEMAPASTIEHDTDKYGNFKRFVQDIGAESKDLDPDKVVHHSYLNLDGKTYGFTPVAALFAELDMLANAKDYNGIKFNNAAVPNKLFKLPEEGPESQNFEMVKETLKQYRKQENKHKDLVMTGEIDVENLNDTGEMEFRELAQYITRVLVMAWGVPPSRVGGIIGSEGATASAMAQAGYNKRIKRMQDKYETLLNDEIFEPLFSIRIKFENPDTKEEIRQAERDLRKTEVVKQQLALGLMTKEGAMNYLDKSRGQVLENLEDADLQVIAQQAASNTEDRDSSASSEPADEAVNQQMTPDRNGGNDATVENQ